MTDATNPVTTPSGQPPAQAPDGTLLNQQATPQTPTDSSPTTPVQETKPETPPAKPEAKDPALLNAKPEGAPEKYSDFTLPEGLTLKPEVLAEAQTLFKGMNLSQDAAQSLLDFHAKQMAEIAQAPIKAVTDTKAAWESEVRAAFGKDIEPGGRVNVAIARVIDAMPKDVGPAFREAMDFTLAGSNPAFVKAMAWIADQFSEGTSVKGNGPSPLGQKSPDAKPLTVAQAMYPNLPSANARS